MTEDYRSTFSLERLWQMLVRRRRVALLALAVPIAGATGFAQFSPRSYRSTATVIVERGGGVSDDDVDARLSSLKSENLSRVRLKSLIRRFDLYRDMRRRQPVEQVVDQMQKDIRVDVDKEERSGRSVVVAIYVTYTAGQPKVAAAIANELAAFYEREDLRMREERAAYMLHKLRDQLTDARRELDQHEARLQDFKRRHLNELPEQVGLHLAALEQLNSQIRVSRGETRTDGATSPRRVRAQIARDARLDQLRELRARFTDEHPDVKRLKREIAMVPYAPDEPAEYADPPSGSTASVATVSRARAAEVRKTVEALRQRAAEHERRILNAPFRQQELEALLPDYAAARTRFQSLSDKYELAKLWDPRHDDGRLRVLDPAVARREFVAPNVPRILAGGLALALVCLVGAVALVERMDTSFHTLDELRSFTNVPVLARVPRRPSWTERRQAQRRTRRFLAMVALVVVAVFGGAAYVGHSARAFVTGAAHSQP